MDIPREPYFCKLPLMPTRGQGQELNKRSSGPTRPITSPDSVCICRRRITVSMAVQTSDKDTSYGIANKSIVRVHFCDSQQRYGFINIDPAIIDKLHITSETILTQEVVAEGILLRRFKEI